LVVERAELMAAERVSESAVMMVEWKGDETVDLLASKKVGWRARMTVGWWAAQKG
jgi:hypothetical protein